MGRALLAVLLAIALRDHEGDAQAITSVVDAKSGAAVADGRYAQSVQGKVLHIEARYDFRDGRTIVERAAVRLVPELVQESWDWTERKRGALVRSYRIDFATGQAVATRVDEKKRWKEHLDVEPGKTFAGIGFVTVIKALREQLRPGQQIELKAVAFTPRPRVASVSVRREQPQQLSMADRRVPADAYTIHPEIPAIARLFVKAPDQHVWLFATGPPAFLRYEGPLVEPDDPVIRVDLIPAQSANAGRSAPRGRRRPR